MYTYSDAMFQYLDNNIFLCHTSVVMLFCRISIYISEYIFALFQWCYIFAVLFCSVVYSSHADIRNKFLNTTGLDLTVL